MPKLADGTRVKVAWREYQTSPPNKAIVFSLDSRHPRCLWRAPYRGDETTNAVMSHDLPQYAVSSRDHAPKWHGDATASGKQRSCRRRQPRSSVHWAESLQPRSSPNNTSHVTSGRRRKQSHARKSTASVRGQPPVEYSLPPAPRRTLVPGMAFTSLLAQADHSHRVPGAVYRKRSSLAARSRETPRTPSGRPRTVTAWITTMTARGSQPVVAVMSRRRRGNSQQIFA